MLPRSPRRRQGFKSHRLQRSVEVRAMKSHRIISVFLFCICLCLLSGLHERFVGRGSSSPGATFRRTASASPQSSGRDDSSPAEEVAIPGPMRSFLRMAAISQKITPEEVIAAAGAQRRHERLSRPASQRNSWSS